MYTNCDSGRENSLFIPLPHQFLKRKMENVVTFFHVLFYASYDILELNNSQISINSFM